MTESFRLSRRDFLYIGILVLAVLVWFHRFFFFGEMLIPPNANSLYPWYGMAAYTEPHPQGSMDAVRESYIAWALDHKYLREGNAPYWNPYILSGTPLLANQFAIPFSPFKLLNVVFSAPRAWSWAIAIKTFLAGLFTYLSLRALGRGYAASTIGGLVWMLSWPLAHQAQTTYNEGTALLAGVFFFILRSYQADQWRERLRHGLLAALLAGFQFLAGNVQMTVYSFVLLLGFALYWAWDHAAPSLYGRTSVKDSLPFPSLFTGREAKNLLFSPFLFTSRQVKNLLFSPSLFTGRGLGGGVRKLRPLLTLVLVYLGGALIGMIQNASSYELLGGSIRGEAQTHLNKGIEPYTAISFLNPWIYFWRNFEFPTLRVDYWLTYRWNPYIGLLPLLACGLAVIFVKNRTARAIAVMTLGVFAVLHLLYWRPIFNLVSGLPGYDALDQTRWLIVLPFPLAVLAAYGIDWLLDEGQAQWRRLRRALWAAALVIPLMLAGMIALRLFFGGEVEAAEALPTTFANQGIQIGTRIMADYYRIENPLFAASFVIALAALGITGAYGSGRLTRRRAEWLLIGLAAADLLFFARVHIASTPSELVYPKTPAIEFLQAQDGIFRIGAAPNTLYEGRPTGPYSRYRDDHGWYLSSSQPILTPNTAALFGLQDIRGYESVYSLRYSQYMAKIDGRETPFGALLTPQTVTHPMLDALNMRYVLAVEPLDDPALTLVYDGEILIYENLKALPRVHLYAEYTVLADADAVLAALASPDYDPKTDLFFETDPQFDLPTEANISQARAEILRYGPNRVSIAVNAPSSAILVLADQNYPGWRAYVDGAETPIHTANTLFRAIQVPAGQHRVEFRYESDVVRWGLWVSAVSFAMVVLGIVILLIF